MTLDFLGDTSKYFNNNYSTGDLVNNTFSGVNYDYSLPTSTDTSGLWGESLFGGGNGLSSLGSLPWSKIIGTAGKLGSGLLTGLASNEVQQQPDYFMEAQWLGNGLAKTGLKSNRQEKQNQLDQMFGWGNVLSQLFPNGFGIFGSSALNTNLGNEGQQSEYSDSQFTDWLDQKKKEYGA